MKEIRWHGRGGQGAVVAARVLATALDKEGKAVMAFPKFGAERRGAPVTAFTAFDDQPIRHKTEVYHLDCLIVIDHLLMRTVDVFYGMKPDGILILNNAEPVIQKYHPNLTLMGTVDATRIGLEEIGRPITNTAMLGAFARTTGWVKLGSLLSGLEQYFTGPALEKNIECTRRGYEETRIARF